MSEVEGRGFQAEPAADDDYWFALFKTEDSAGTDRDLTQDEIPSTFDLTPPTQVLRDDISQLPDAPLSEPPTELSSSDDPWEMAQTIMDADQLLELRVFDHNKGGLLVIWNGIQGFVPASQLVDFPQFHVPRERIQTLAEWQGRTLPLKIIEVNKANNRLIFSERASLVAAGQREDLLNGVKQGEQLQGTVTNLTEFGAFVDLGGVEGLVHISEISWSRVTHPSALLHQGQPVRVVVLNVDRSAGRVALSIKRLNADPWRTAESRYRPGQLVQGVVGNITTYGAFIILEEELEGLVHISELAEGHFMHPRDVVRSGDRVVARVLSVDAGHKRIALSLRGVSTSPGSGQ